MGGISSQVVRPSGGENEFERRVFASNAHSTSVATILLTEGWQRSSIAAILGTVGALALTGLLGALATSVMGFTYTAGSDLAFLTTQSGAGLDLRGLLLAAFILGAAGVLDDATVTQAALVEELADKGNLDGRQLFNSAMGIGRSHIGATINTLFLAYVAVGLPLLVVLVVSRQPTDLVLNDEEIATEIVRTLVGCIGIIAAVPFTTFVASLLATMSSPSVRAGATDRHPYLVAAITVVILVLLGATTVLPLTSGPTRALTQPVFDPGASFLAASPDAGSPATGEASPSAVDTAGPGSEDQESPPADPALAERGEALPLTAGGETAGTMTVVKWTLKPAKAPRTGERFTVVVRYDATTELDLGAGLWEAVLEDGTEIPLTLADGDGLDGSLAAGQSRQVTLAGDLPKRKGSPFLVYLDQATSAFWFAIPIE